jgi:enoyl-CoA hydratase/carnithine racemase
LELIWSGAIFDAQTALEMGYVQRVVPQESLMEEACAFARTLAEGPPITMQLAKRLVYRAQSQTFVESLEAAQAAMSIVQSTEDSKEGPLAFREKRRPAFEGR